MLAPERAAERDRPSVAPIHRAQPSGAPARAIPAARQLVRPWTVAAALAVLSLVLHPEAADLSAHVFRTELFRREGFTLWDNQWYAGHHTLGYSVLFPPLAALLGPRVVGALAAIAAAVLFERLVRAHFGDRARVGALWFAAATATNLFSGRMPFALGIALGLAALLALARGRTAAAVALAALTSLASPVAGLFLGLAGVAGGVGGPMRRAAGAALAVGAVAPILALAVAFPEGGTFPFVASALWPTLAAAAAAAVLLGREQPALRAGAAIYGAAALAAFVIDTPMGGNASRLGMLFAGPLLACALWGRRPLALALVALPLVYWQWSPPIRDVVRAADDPSTEAAYYAPLLAFLDRATPPAAPPPRIEIPLTANFWEAARVAPTIPLARGWERQLDIKENGLFYAGALTTARYRSWLHRTGVSYVALPDARLDPSARAEARLVRAGQPYLRPVWRGANWRVYAVRDATGIVSGAARLTGLGADSFSVSTTRPGTTLVRIRYTPYWELASGRGCVERATGGWTRLRLRASGPAHVVARFAVGRIGSTEPRCR